MLRFLRCALLACATVPLAAVAQDASYPARTISIVTPQPPGSGSSLLARTLAERLAQRWNQPVIVEEKPGAAGAIAADFVARARPDGHTLLVGSAGQMAIAPLMGKLSYAPEQFVALAHLGSAPNVLVVSAKSQVTTVQGLVDKARQTAAGLNYGSLGTGSIGQVTIDALVQRAGMRAVSIPYKSEPQAVIELLGGQVDFLVAAIPTVLPHIKAGTLIPLGVTSATPSALLPQVRPLSELGFPEIRLAQWYGLFGPVGMNKDVAKKITDTVRAIYSEPQLQARLSEFSLEPPTSGEQDFTAFIVTDRGKWQRLLKLPSTP